MSAKKAPEAFKTIGEVAEILKVPQHVLRFWESRFSQIRPIKGPGGRRHYRAEDVAFLEGLQRLLYGEKYTIKGVQQLIKDRGVAWVVKGVLGAPARTPTRSPTRSPARSTTSGGTTSGATTSGVDKKVLLGVLRRLEGLQKRLGEFVE